MSDANSIELAGIWKQDFLNKATKTRETIETLPSGVRTTHVENVKDFDPQSVPVLLLGNKYDLVSCCEKLKRLLLITNGRDRTDRDRKLQWYWLMG